MAANGLMSFAAACPSVLSSSNSKFAVGRSFGVGFFGSSRFTMTADWFPGSARPPYLDGSAPG
ncbi:hypothetical protein M569_16849 [Genlisea aurea]|uniref:Chlorophyll a-b binding protein, chloroplastic n=1 Tax=Genlisea aurea TaxID=192259 RepID=S8BUC3_9LAMI|nr:hypothetical protein M569_16849 [Genlisea aurea]